MIPALQEYLTSRSFAEVSAQSAPQPGIAVREYENGEFCVRIINERKSDVYVQIAPISKPEERRFLNGVVAFLTGDDSATSRTGKYAQWLTEHHRAIASLCSASPEGEEQREQYLAWEREFAIREQSRLAAAADSTRTQHKPWWKLW